MREKPREPGELASNWNAAFPRQAAGGLVVVLAVL